MGDTLNKDSPGWGTDLARVMAPWEHKYMDKFGPLCKQMAEEKDACDTCPRPQFKYPAADGLGIAPLQLDRTRSGPHHEQEVWRVWSQVPEARGRAQEGFRQ